MKHFHARLDDIKNGNTVSEDQMSYFVRKHMEDPAKMTAADIYINSSGSFLAASDTTAATLSAIIYYLYKYPRTLNILRKEIDDFNVAGRLSDSITYHEAIELQYLQVVIKEALRIHPIFSGPMERTVPAGGATVAGVHFPEGVSC
jgi:cytochrome P450